MTDGANYTLRDEIRDFWSARAETFDQSVGHEIFSDAERRGWHRLLRRHLGHGEGRAALDLACGTGVISQLMDELGFAVTGLDWSEPMLGKARAKARQRGAEIRFVAGDAENTREPPESYDVIVTRHLVWTLVDPPAAFREWLSLLKPGGKLLVVDGNLGRGTWVGAVRRRWATIVGRPLGNTHLDAEMTRQHESIRSRVHFSGEMRAYDVCALLEAAGFRDCVVDRNLWDIHWAQARRMSVLQGLDRLLSDRYAICCQRPATVTPDTLGASCPTVDPKEWSR